MSILGDGNLFKADVGKYKNRSKVECGAESSTKSSAALGLLVLMVAALYCG
ncbi:MULTISPECIES: hypothetical protein [unclassified Helicobacter]|uniref:hypothetical protein n=1 Tax=unclassified Helicobacter TaxID=2593540 RepID=UPI0012E8CD95|nr:MULTISPECIES: hypothetical protein [unclassified Helicobacter]